MRCLFRWRLKCLCPPRNTSRKGKQEKNTRSRASRFRFKLKNGASQCIGCPNIELAAVPTGAATLLGANKWSQRLTLNLENKPAARYTKRRSRWRPAEPILQDPSRYSLKEVPRGPEVWSGPVRGCRKPFWRIRAADGPKRSLEAWVGKPDPVRGWSLFEGYGPQTVQKGDCRPSCFFSRAPGNLAISRGMFDSFVGCWI